MKGYICNQNYKKYTLVIYGNQNSLKFIRAKQQKHVDEQKVEEKN